MNLINPYRFTGAAAGESSIAFTDYDTTSGGGAGPYSWNNMAIGPASPDRYVVLVFSFVESTAIRTITSFTVAGQSTSLVISNRSPDSAIGGVIAIYITDAPVTSGTTANIIQTLSGNVDCKGLAIYALRGIASTTPTATVSTDTSGETKALTVSANGAVIGGAVNAGSSNRTFTATGITEDVDATLESGIGTFTAASKGGLSAQSLDITFTASGSGNFSAVAASFA